MRNPTACERGGVAALVALSFAALTTTARADDKQACSDAYAQTQTLRKGGQLQQAREQALICVKDACPEFIRTDCATWLGQIDASQPTVVLDVKDASGASTTSGKVELDGKPWLDAVDVRAVPIDPGSHTLRVTIPGQSPQEQKLIVREGEKAKQIVVSFAAAAPTAPAGVGPALAPTVAPPDETTSSGPGAAPWIIGGTGVALVAVGAVLGIVVLGERSTYDEHCVDGCDAEADAARDTGESLGPISTVAFVLGGAGIAVGAIWLAVGSDDGEASALQTGPVVTGEGVRWAARGRF